MEITLKSELAQPFSVSTEPDSFGHIFSNIYPFADAGSVGSQPANIPDLIGNHDIAMNYHADPTESGGINTGGNLELGNHGNGQTNTWGTFNVPVGWGTGLTANSRIYLVEFIYKYSSARQFLISGHFHLEFKTSTTMTVMIENQSAHGIRYYNKTHNFADGQRVCIAVQMNKSDNSYSMVINGVDVTSELYANGNPFTGNISNQTPLDWLLLGRWSSAGWDKYYGFDGDINLLAVGTDFNGSELSVSQMIELTNNPYQILQQEQVSTGTEQTIVAVQSQQLTQSQLIDITSFNVIGAIVCEQATQVQSVDLTLNNQTKAIVAEQATEVSLSAIAHVSNLTAVIIEQVTHAELASLEESQLITAIQSQQLTESITVDVTTDGAQDVNVVVTEQKTESQALTLEQRLQLHATITEQLAESINTEISQSALTKAITIEQITESVIVNVDESNGIFVSVVQTEQLAETQAADVDVTAITNAIITEQLTQFTTQQIGIDLTLSAIVAEQLTHAELIDIVVKNISQQLNLDIDQITIEMLTPTYTIESLTPTYTIEHLH